nr:histidine phosphatase family protein [Aurantiacibacter suaedae]
MKRLGLFRHAKSDWDDMSLRDFDRGLNARGQRGAALMGRHIAEYGAKWDRVLASPAKRIKLTLESSALKVPVDYVDAAYLADSTTLMAMLTAIAGDPSAVMLAGHNPGMQELALDLAGATNENALFGEVLEKFPTAGFAVLDLAIDKWADCAPNCGRIVHFARPRDLDPELGPVGVG